MLKAMQEAGWTEFPRQWWSACKYAKTLFKQSLIRMDTHLCNALFYQLPFFLEEEYVENASYVDADIGGVLKVMGMAGTLTAKGYYMLASP